MSRDYPIRTHALPAIPSHTTILWHDHGGMDLLCIASLHSCGLCDVELLSDGRQATVQSVIVCCARNNCIKSLQRMQRDCAI